MTPRLKPVEVSASELEKIAFNSGETLHLGGPFPVCRVKGQTYWCQPLPEQRKPGAES